MRTKLFLIACAAIVICTTSCKEEKSKGRIEDAFMEYVKTDFDDPDDFVEITKIGEPDTVINYKKLKYFSDFVQQFGESLPEIMRDKANKARQTLLSDTAYRILSYPIKVRQKSKDGLVVREYWVIDENGKMWAQDHVHMIDELPEFARTIYEASVEITEN